MKKIGLLILLAFAFAAGFAQTSRPFTATYSFSREGNVQSFAYNGNPILGLNMGNLNKVGVDSWTYRDGFRAVNWPTTDEIDTGKYIGFDMTAAAGYKFTVTKITFGMGRSGSGITKAQWRGSSSKTTLGYEDMDPFTNYTFAYTSDTDISNVGGVLTIVDRNYNRNFLDIGLSLVGNTDYQDITNCGFRMYMYDAEILAGDSGLFSKIKIEGTVEPEDNGTNPSPVFSIASAAPTYITNVEGWAPTDNQRFCVGGSYLAGNIRVTTSSNFPMSVGGTPTNNLMLTHQSGNILEDIYVILGDNLQIGDYTGNITVQYCATGAEITVPLNGSVIAPPPDWYCVNFEGIGETKPLFDKGTVYLNGLEWELDGVKIADEPINGSRRAHFQGSGTSSMTMFEEKVGGACQISFKYQRYGTGDPVYWVVDYSTNGGHAWTQVGDPFTPGVEEQTFEGTISKTDDIMVRIIRYDGEGADMILDDLIILDYCDFLNNKPKQVGENSEYTVTVTGGNGNYDHEYELDTSTVFDFTVDFHKYITLTREGPWTITTAVPVMDPNFDYFTAYKHGNAWIIMPMPEGIASYAVSPQRSVAADPGTELVIGSAEKQQDNPTLPVTLSHFSATMTAQNYVNLTWVSQTETNLMGYNVLRSADEDLSNARQICAMIEGTNTSEAQTYSYLDKELVEDGTYYYWLQSVDMDGSTGFHGPASVVFSITGDSGTPAIPTATQLEDAYPNPFNPNTTLRYQLKDAGNVKIDIYNQRGQLVRSFAQSHDAAGYYGILWDGRDSNGRALASGVYLYRMTSGKYSGVKKMVLQK